MTQSIIEVSIEDILDFNPDVKSYDKKVVIEKLDYHMMKSSRDIKGFSLRLDAFSIFLICKGTMEIAIDNKKYILSDNYVLHIMDMHVIRDMRLSEDFKGYHLIIERNFFCEIMLNSRRLPASCIASIHDRPILKLQEEDAGFLEEYIIRLLRNIKRTDHAWLSDLVKNDLRGFLLEMSNIIYQSNKDKDRVSPSGKDMLFFLFIQLLNAHGKDEHEVNFYAKELAITPEYLSRILKRITGKTAMQWITETVVREAELRLQNPAISIQSIADELQFSDQSSFGKFFKKHKNISPLKYREKTISEL